MNWLKRTAEDNRTTHLITVQHKEVPPATIKQIVADTVGDSVSINEYDAAGITKIYGPLKYQEPIRLAIDKYIKDHD